MAITLDMSKRDHMVAQVVKNGVVRGVHELLRNQGYIDVHPTTETVSAAYNPVTGRQVLSVTMHFEME